MTVEPPELTTGPFIQPGPCGDPECHVLHLNPQRPIHPPDYVDSRKVRVVAYGPDGETDITEGVQALYDLVLSSMDWGSGFWTAEDAAPVAVVARACGFPKIQEVEKYLLDRQHHEEAVKTWKTLREEYNPYPVPQEHTKHIWSSVGRCMWPTCREVQG